MSWQPILSCQNSCQSKTYDSNKLRQCFSENFSKIQIYGDSRSRQFWLFLKNLIFSEDQFVYDAKSNANQNLQNQNITASPNFYSEDGFLPIFNVNMEQQVAFYDTPVKIWKSGVIILQQDWTIFTENVNQHLTKIAAQSISDIPKLIIIFNPVLHSLKEDELHGSDFYLPNPPKFTKNFHLFENSTFSLIKQILSKNTEMKFVFYAAELLDDHHPQHDNNLKRRKIHKRKNIFIKKFNQMVELECAKLMELFPGWIYYIGGNLKTMLSPVENKTMLVESIHLSHKRSYPFLANPAMLANLNFLLRVILFNELGFLFLDCS